MSGALLAGASAFSLAQQAAHAAGVIPAFIRAPRSIGVIIPDVVIDEQHNDRVELTQHPVAQGSPITDHAFIQPPRLSMRIGFTNSNPVGAAVQGFMSGGLIGGAEGLFNAFVEERCRAIYADLLDLQQRREPMEVTTGKRSYQDMMITELSVRTDRTSEYSLFVDVQMEQVFIVETRTTTQAPQENQALPDRTVKAEDLPPQQTVPQGPRKSLLRQVRESLFGAPPR